MDKTPGKGSAFLLRRRGKSILRFSRADSFNKPRRRLLQTVLRTCYDRLSLHARAARDLRVLPSVRPCLLVVGFPPQGPLPHHTISLLCGRGGCEVSQRLLRVGDLLHCSAVSAIVSHQKLSSLQCSGAEPTRDSSCKGCGGNMGG